MAYNTNQFCWHGCISTNPDDAASFYSKVLGWDVQSVEMGDDTATMFANAGVPRAHVMAPPMEGIPSHWDNYLRVDDVDAATKACVEHGGAVMVPGTDIAPGRFSVVTSPSGAAISLFHEADEAASEHAPNYVGGVHWVELHSTDIDADLAWLKAALGFEIDTMPMPNGNYYILKANGEQRGGATPQQNPGAPSMWLTWFQVADVDGTVNTANDAGGQALMPPFDVPGVGRMSILSDNTGGVFGVITPPA